MENNKVRFIRVRGRIVPIKQKKIDSTAAITGAVAGTAIAADAARTRTVYQNKKGIEITRKRFAVQPFVYDSLGDSLTMTKNGKKVGSVRYYVAKKDGWGAISWLGVKKSERRKGYSKILARQAAMGLREKGVTETFQHVVHKGSINSQYNRARDRFFKEIYTSKTGGATYAQITKTEALKNVRYYRKMGRKTSNVFRETVIKSVGRQKAFMSALTKTKLSIGVGIALSSLLYLGARKNEK